MGSEPKSMAYLLRTGLANLKADERPPGLDDETREELVARMAAAKVADAPKFLESCGIKARAIRAVLDNPTRTPAWEQCAAMWETEGRCFALLMGGVGTGKSVAAASLFLRLSKPKVVHLSSVGTFEVDGWGWGQGERVRAHELAGMSYFGADRARAQRLESVRLLAIDDLGAELLSDGFKAQLDALLDARHDAELRTVITTNLDGATFKARYGERIADRIRQDGQPISTGTVSMRKAVAS